jgi:hypothetical protein
MLLLGLAGFVGLVVPLTITYNAFLVLVLAGLAVTIVARARATYRDLQSTD